MTNSYIRSRVKEGLAIIDMVIKNGKIVTPEGIYKGGIGINDGEIVFIGKDPHLPPAEETIDINQNLILPGIIDVHVHLKDLGRSDWEDFETGTNAAAAGGVTTVMEMPQTVPPCATVEAFKQKKNAVQRKAVVNVALYGASGTYNINNLLSLAEAGVIGYKASMGLPVQKLGEKEEIMLNKMREEELKPSQVTDNGSFLEVLKKIAKTNLPCCVHAESADICEYYRRKLWNGKRDILAFLKSRPDIAEAEAITRTLLLANEAGARSHICHLSSKKAVGIMRQAKAVNQHVTAETCPHYLKFTIDEVEKLGPYGKITPPIRRRNDREELWNGILDGTIDVICSDHAPCLKEMKEIGWNNIWEAAAGTPGIEAMLPVMLTFVNKGVISLEKLVKVMSENPARIFGLFPRKGVLRVGSDADLTIVDIKRETKLSVDRFYTKAKSNALLYDGVEVHGVPILTIVNGKIVMKEGEVIGKPGAGLFVRPLTTFFQT